MLSQTTSSLTAATHPSIPHPQTHQHSLADLHRMGYITSHQSSFMETAVAPLAMKITLETIAMIIIMRMAEDGMEVDEAVAVGAAPSAWEVA